MFSTISQILFRPTLANVLVFSIWAHAGVFAAAKTMEAWGFFSIGVPATEVVEVTVSVNEPIERPEFAGATHVAQFQISVPTPQVEPEVRDSEDSLEPTELQPAPPDFDVDAAHDVQAELEATSEVTVTKQDAAPVFLQLARSTPRTVVSATDDAIAESAAAQNRAVRPESEKTLTIREPALRTAARREPLEFQPPVPTVSIPQVAGTDNKSQPTFVGGEALQYPAEAYRRGIEGDVLLRLFVAADGKVERVEIKKSSGHAILDNAAVAAVSTWHGEPARQRGQPVATTELLPVKFRLDPQ